MRLNELDALSRQLLEFINAFVSCFPRSDQRHGCLLYLSGLLLDGERKSIQPMAERLQGGNMQALQQFIADSPWSFQQLATELYRLMVRRLHLAEPVVVIDDTSLPKQGKKSVGVARQYCGALGKVANCQVLVTLQAIGDHGHIPIVARLYLPKEWTENPQRMMDAHIPRREGIFREKWKIALLLLDEARGVCRPGPVLMDAAYGSNRHLRAEVDKRQLQFVAQIPGTETFWDGSVPIAHRPPTPRVGRPRKHLQPADRRPRPKSADAWAKELFAHSRVRHLRLRLGKPISVDYVAVRVYETFRTPWRKIGIRRWLVIERLAHGETKYYVSNLPQSTKPAAIVRLAHQRWKIEQGYQQLKEELGLDHYEGRFWAGLHHHVLMCMMAFDFLQLLAAKRGQRKKNLSHASRGAPPNQPAGERNRLPSMRSHLPLEASDSARFVVK